MSRTVIGRKPPLGPVRLAGGRKHGQDSAAKIESQRSRHDSTVTGGLAWEAFQGSTMSLKKFSTRRLTTLAIGVALAVGGSLPFAMAPVAAQQATGPIELAPGAPDKHVVVKGDTLWDISATFLKSPWRWPEVWQLNREQIANPHLIYPGDIVYLDTSGASPRLRL